MRTIINNTKSERKGSLLHSNKLSSFERLLITCVNFLITTNNISKSRDTIEIKSCKLDAVNMNNEQLKN